MAAASPYRGYWERKAIVAASPHFPVVRWWPTGDLCDVERLYLEALRPCRRVLDVGAGDLAIMRKLQAAGLAATYDTLDVGDERAYTYRTLDEVRDGYDGILCLDVIEHLPLEAGLAMLDRMAALLQPGGVLIVQTPNARCARDPMAWDMSHLHCYNLPDLRGYLVQRGLAVDGYRVALGAARPGPAERLRGLLGRLVISGLIGADWTDNILVVARRPA